MASQINTATPVASYEEYQEGVAAANAKYTSSIDAQDVAIGWTAQNEEGLILPEQLPGQVFLPSQLPDPARALDAGLPAVLVPEYLVTTDTDHPSGPEPWEIGENPTAVRDAVRARVEAENKAAEDESSSRKSSSSKSSSAKSSTASTPAASSSSTTTSAS